MGLFNIKFNKKDRNINTFVCEVCKKELPKKYLHSHSVCADCANAKAKSTMHTTLNDLEPLITVHPESHTWGDLRLHKKTQEAYIVHWEDTYQGYFGVVPTILSISKATLEAAMSIVEKEYDSCTVAFSQAKRNNWKTPFVINGNSYHIEWFVVVDDVEISMNEIFSNEKVFDVPAQCLTKEQHAKYAEYYHRPGPYEHYFTLPAECCQKLIRKLIPLEF